jgi:phosphate-selective porin OprO/OprP
MTKEKKRILAGVALSALMVMQGAARADDASAEIRLLKARLKQLEEKVANQSRKDKEIQKQISRAAPPPMVCKDGPCPPPPPPVFVTFGNGLKVESFDHNFSFKIGGYINVDGGGSTQPELGKSTAAKLTRARLQVEGRAFKYWDYKLQYEFAATSTTPAGGIRDAYLALRYYDPVTLQIGNFYEPMGLERTSSRLNQDFMERALASDALTPSRHIGFAALTHGKDWSVKAGVFSTSVEDRASAPLAGVPAYAFPATSVATGGLQYFDVAGRVTYAPIMEKEALVHFGGSARYQRPNDATGATDNRVMFVAAGQASEANVLGESLLGTIDLSCGAVQTRAGVAATAVAGKCVKDVVNYGAEFVASYGPFSVQGEYLGAHYNRDGNALAFAATNAALNGNQFARGGSTVDFNGYYVYGTWYLTGESRAEAYSVNGLNPATFGQIKILQPFSKGGVGAWEVGARFSELNLNNGGILGGRQQDLTLGLNWYPDKGIRFMANWVRVMNLVGPAQPLTTGIYNQPFLAGAHPNLFVMRAQVNW